jgi:amino-acid N-acetyltransferase
MSTVFNFTFVPWFRSVAPYIHTHRGKTFVVALAGEAIAAGKLQNIAQDLALIQSMGVKIVLVHGFRPQVNEQLAAKGHEARYSHGIRITDEVALDSAQEAAGQLRYEIEAAFSQGLPNTPMAGSTVRVISGNFITARPIGVVDGVDFKHSGLVRKVDAVGIRRTLDFGAMVLMSPFGFSPTGEAFNLTMEEVATSVAISIQADKLIFLTEIPGIRIDSELPESEDNPIDTELPLAAAEKLLASLPPPQRPTDTAFYLQHCVKACKAGVERNHILPFALDGSLLLEIYVHDGVGTMVIDEKLESLREATAADRALRARRHAGEARPHRNRARRGPLHRHRARRRDLRLRGALPLPRGSHGRDGSADSVAPVAIAGRRRAHPQAHRASRQGHGPGKHLRAHHAHHALVFEARLPAGQPRLAARSPQAQVQLGPQEPGAGQENLNP